MPCALRRPLFRWPIPMSEMSSTMTSWRSGKLASARKRPRASIMPVIVSEFQKV
jgi:hypothetical protein